MVSWVKVFGMGLLSLFVVVMASCKPKSLAEGLYAEVVTDKGSFTMQLYPDQAPLTVMNFVGLAEGILAENRVNESTSLEEEEEGSVAEMPDMQDKGFYDGMVFHRVEDQFVVQTGDPEGVGIGGPGYVIPDEITDLKHNRKGVVGMANSGPHTNGSQFYVTLSDGESVAYLDGKYTIFGQVVRGFSVVEQIEVGDVLHDITILRKGEPYVSYRVTQEGFEELREQRIADIQRSIHEYIHQKWPMAVMGEDGIYRYSVKTGEGSKVDTSLPIKLLVNQEVIMGYSDQEIAMGEDEEIVIDDLAAQPFLPFLKELIEQMEVGSRRGVILSEEFIRGNQGREADPSQLALSYVQLELEIIENA